MLNILESLLFSSGCAPVVFIQVLKNVLFNILYYAAEGCKNQVFALLFTIRIYCTFRCFVMEFNSENYALILSSVIPCFVVFLGFVFGVM